MTEKSIQESSSPRICVLSESYYPRVGGTPTHARLIAEGLTTSGLDVMVVTRRWERETEESEQVGGVEVCRIGPVGFGQMKKWRMLFTSMPALIRLRKKYDVIYVPAFRVLGIAAVVISRWFGKRCVLRAASQGEMSGAFFGPGLKKRRLRPEALPVRVAMALRNRLLRKADAFVAISSDIAGEFRGCGVPEGIIHRIPNGVDTRAFSPVDEQAKSELRDKLGIPREATVAVYTGRLVTYKGLPLLLRVWEKICDRFPSTRLLLVGAGGNDIHNCEEELVQFCAERDLDDRVSFAGDVDNVSEYLQAADIFVLPTENEVFSNSLLEAMACGLAIVSTAVGGLADVVRNDENSVVVGPGDFDELLDAISKLINDRQSAARIGKTALQAAREKYSREIVAGEYERLFRTLSPSQGGS